MLCNMFITYTSISCTSNFNFEISASVELYHDRCIHSTDFFKRFSSEIFTKTTLSICKKKFQTPGEVTNDPRFVTKYIRAQQMSRADLSRP